MAKRWAKYKGYIVHHFSSDERERQLLLGSIDPHTAAKLGFADHGNGEFIKWVPHEDIEYRWEEHFLASYHGNRFYILAESENQYRLWTDDIEAGKACGFVQTHKYEMEKWIPKTAVDNVIKETRMYIWNGQKWARV